MYLWSEKISEYPDFHITGDACAFLSLMTDDKVFRFKGKISCDRVGKVR